MENTSSTTNHETLITLQEQLTGAGIDLSRWGNDQAKTLADLYREIEQGETTLTTNEAGEIVRTIQVASINVYCHPAAGKTYLLREDRQILKDGRVRRRGLENSVGEKVKSTENAQQAVLRGIAEELPGIGTEGITSLESTNTQEELRESSSYPGLPTQYTFFNFDATVKPELFKPEGYIVKERDPTTHFVWEKVASD